MHIANRQIWQFNLTAKLRLITTDRIDSWVLLKDFWKPLGNYRRGNSAFDIIPPTIQLTTGQIFGWNFFVGLKKALEKICSLAPFYYLYDINLSHFLCVF